MLTPMTRAGGLPAELEIRMADEGRLVARHVPFPLGSGGVTAVPPDDVFYGKRVAFLARSQVPFSFYDGSPYRAKPDAIGFVVRNLTVIRLHLLK